MLSVMDTSISPWSSSIWMKAQRGVPALTSPVAPPHSRITSPGSNRKPPKIVKISTTQDSFSLKPPQLLRNTYNDSEEDYRDLFEQLKIKPSFYEQFFHFIKVFRQRQDVREFLQSGTQEGIKEVSGQFLEEYGRLVWMRRGKNCQQDPKFREVFFHHKDDADSLWALLDNLWLDIRNLCFETERAAPRKTLWNSADMRRPTAPEPRVAYGTFSPTSSVGSLDVEEEQIAINFINKVRVEVHGLPGNVRTRTVEEEDFSHDTPFPSIEINADFVGKSRSDCNGKRDSRVTLDLDALVECGERDWWENPEQQDFAHRMFGR